jgi:hypothetical protein
VDVSPTSWLRTFSMAVMDDETNTVTHRRDRKRGGEDLNVSHIPI